MSVFITSAVIIIMLILLIKEVYDPLKVFVLVIATFLILGYISIEEVTSGFSNAGVLSVAVLFVIAGSVEQSSYFNELTKFKNIDEEKFNPVTLFGSVMGASAFLNNTPIVSIFIPITNKIANKTGISASKLLMPISFLSILGGLLTVIGTSTNLVASGLLVDMGLEPLSFFELTKITLPAVIIGFIYICMFYKTRLPDNSEVLKQSIKQANNHFIRFVAKEESSIIGKSIKDANLRALTGVYLVEIERNNNRIFPITPDEVIKPNDILVFTGQTDKIDELRSIDNLVIETEEEIHSNYFNYDNTEIIEVVLTQYIAKPNLTIKELKFREKYNAVVIGVIRNGECIKEKIGSITLKLGDILLIIADKSTISLIEYDNAFTVINVEERKAVEHNKKSIYPFIAFIGTILGSLIFDVDIIYTAFIGVAFLFVTNTIQVKQALNMVDFKTIIMISLSFAIGKALINSGTAVYIAEMLEPLMDGLNPILMMMIVFIFTTLLTTVITNNAAVILAIPIVFEIVSLTTYDVRPFLLVTIVGASAAFLSPYGYQTNTMVYGAGAYKYGDFIKFGYPLVLILMVVCSISSYLLFLL